MQINKKAICILFSKNEIFCSLLANKDEYIKQTIQCFRIMKIYRQIHDSGRVGKKLRLHLNLASVIMINQEEWWRIKNNDKMFDLNIAMRIFFDYLWRHMAFWSDFRPFSRLKNQNLPCQNECFVYGGIVSDPVCR